MVYSKRVVKPLVVSLLEELDVKNPTPEQYKAAESFVSMVILPPEEGIPQEGLTATEWLCLNLAASGFSIDETAEKLSMARGTIKNYRERIRHKLRCKNMAQAICKAFLSREEQRVPEE